jgi:hypothetical protein
VDTKDRLRHRRSITEIIPPLVDWPQCRNLLVAFSDLVEERGGLPVNPIAVSVWWTMSTTHIGIILNASWFEVPI